MILAQRFHGDQQVLLQYRGQTYLLHEGLSQQEVVTKLRAASADIRVQTSSVILGKSGTSLDFDSDGGKLGSITVGPP